MEAGERSEHFKSADAFLKIEAVKPNVSSVVLFCVRGTTTLSHKFLGLGSEMLMALDFKRVLFDTIL